MDVEFSWFSYYVGFLIEVSRLFRVLKYFVTLSLIATLKSPMYIKLIKNSAIFITDKIQVASVIQKFVFMQIVRVIEKPLYFL